ncbi:MULTISPECIES: N-acetylglucosamine-6-phosphate deacetylase [Sphingobacterium]|uniref:N-acetylglucosamine-6-phosphate deacetylase n=1 Tax=Sphingobacterium TaxID=28453 RepID=UPI0013DA3D20|nr:MULTISPECIES: N-acetylglucosamine-6-phosphate deacetylase [unclassified Sphingobacterium]
MKEEIALYNGTIYSEYDIINDGALLISDGKVLRTVPANQIPAGFEPVDVEGDNICPGLIDLQIYGAGGSLFSADLTLESLIHIEETLLAQGCTSFYLTLATNTLEVFREAIRVYKTAKPRNTLGLHLEGPFLNPKKRGAHPAELILKANVTLLEDLLADVADTVGMLTVAPELLNEECLAYLTSKDILVSAGHSDATFEEATSSFAKGIATVTHLWNAMSALHHREVGLPGAVFNHDKACASVIVDGIHVDFEAVKLAKKVMGERLFLITDAVTDCNKDIYHHVLNDDHYVLPDGTLSGSAMTMLGSIRNCVEKVGLPLDEAIRMATVYPVRLIKRKDLGHLRAGAKANVLVFDKDFNVKKVYFEGEKV